MRTNRHNMPKPESSTGKKRCTRSSKSDENLHQSGKCEDVHLNSQSSSSDIDTETVDETVDETVQDGVHKSEKRPTSRNKATLEQAKTVFKSPEYRGQRGKPTGNKYVSKEDAHVRERSGLCTILLYVILPFSFICLSVAVVNYLPEEIRPDYMNRGNTRDKFDYPKIFESRLQVVRDQFPNQTNRFWTILRSRGLSHLRNRKPDQPLVVLLGAPPSAHNVVDCLAKKLAWSLDPEVSPSNFIDGSAYNKDDGHNAKKILDNKLKDIFERGVRSALVMHLEQLPPPSPLLFYKYCDNDEAPFKHAGIIFTAYLPNEPNSELSPVEAEGSIETFLSDIAWSKYPYEADSISALLSRIADTVALVSQETTKVVHSVCNIQ